MNVKQVIIARRDLKMSPGKLAAQVSHASMGAVFQMGKVHESFNAKNELITREYILPIQHLPSIDEWLFNGSFTKVVLAVESELELRDLHAKLQSVGLFPVLIEDNGRTEFGGVTTATCVGLPPYVSEEIDKFTGHLRLF